MPEWMYCAQRLPMTSSRLAALLAAQAKPIGVIHGCEASRLSSLSRATDPGGQLDILRSSEVNGVCRNIRTLYNFEPPATDAEIRAAALQFVRKISGFATPSAANQEAFNRAVAGVTQASAALLNSLMTTAAPRDREIEAAKARARAVRRFGS